MPCDTPPPPSPLDDIINDGNIEELDESMYDFIDAEELESMPQDDSSMTFFGHEDAVFSCNIDRTGQYVATGSQDETAFVWNASNGTLKFKCTGHKDSVIFADFSPDSKYVASVDMMGVVQVFDMDDGGLVWHFDTFDFTWANWLRESSVLLAGSIDGSCWKWSIPDGTSHVYENAGVGCSIGAVSNDDKKLAVGYSDGSMKFWSLSNDSNLGSLSGPSAFKAPLTSIEYSPDNALMIAASEDGTAKLVKMSDFKVLWTLTVCEADHNHEHLSVESVGFCNNPSLIAVGTNCGFLGVFDISSKTKRFSVSLNSSIVKLICDTSDPVVFVALTEGITQAYDIRTGLAIKTWSGHKASVLDLAMSSDLSMILTCSEDTTCKLFERGIL